MKYSLNRIIAAIALACICLSHPANAAILTKGKNVKVMPVGDSITLGKVLKTGGYRSVLYDWLTAAGYTITYVGKEDDGKPENATINSSKMTPPFPHEGYGSFRIDNIQDGATIEKRTAPPIKTTLETYKPDLVLLMIGTNDILQNWALDQANERLEKLVETIFATDPKITLLVASLPPIGRERVGKEALVASYNAAIPGMAAKQKALHHEIYFVDVHAALAARTRNGLGGDVLHPSSDGYQAIAAAWYHELTGETAPLPPPLPLPPVAKSQPRLRPLQHRLQCILNLTIWSFETARLSLKLPHTNSYSKIADDSPGEEHIL